MQLYALGLNHNTAPLAIREQMVFHAEKLQAALRELTQTKPVGEAAILSTCNRTELYCSAAEPQEALYWLADYQRVKPQELKPYLYTLPKEQAVRHAFRVASGLESMVLGEPQILGQMKEAVRQAESAGTLGTLLHKLFQRSFAVAKEVRTNTQIGANVVSMAAASVKLAARIFPSLKEQKILFIGAGEMIELCATHFAAQQPRAITVASRTLERARALAHRFNGRAIELREMSEQLHEYDIVVSCTASSLPILGKGTVERAIKARRHRPMFMVDLAVPRDIETEVSTLEDVYLYTIDDLRQAVDANLRSRQEAAAQADALIDLSVTHYLAWRHALDSGNPLPLMRRAAEQQRDAVLARARALLANGRTPEQALDYLAHTLTNKLMHAPSANLRAAAMQGDAELLRAAERLFEATDDSKDSDA